MGSCPPSLLYWPSQLHRAMLAAWLWVQGHTQTSPKACKHVCKYVDWNGSGAMLTFIQSAGVAPEVNLRITQARQHAKDLSWLWNPGQTSAEVQNRGISGSIKRTYVTQNFFRKKKEKKVFFTFVVDKVVVLLRWMYPTGEKPRSATNWATLQGPNWIVYVNIFLWLLW